MIAPAAVRRALLAIAVAGPAAAASLAAQDPAPGPTPADLIRKLRSGTLDEPGRAAVVDALLAAGDEGARRLFLTVRMDVERGIPALRKGFVRHLRDLERSATKLLQIQQHGAAAKRIDELRSAALALSRGADLTKEVIRAEIDPRYAELERLCVVAVDDVFRVDTALAADRDAIDAEAERLVRRFLEQERAETALLASEEGARFLDRYPLTDDPRILADEFRAARREVVERAVAEAAGHGRVFAANREPLATLDPEEADGIRRLNRIRGVLGLPALAVDLKLCDAGRDHSKDMVELGFFAHTSPVPGKESPGQRAARAGTSGGAENIAAGQPDGAGAIRAWWYSPGHHRNMLGGHGRIGLGRHRQHWTQMFGG